MPLVDRGYCPECHETGKLLEATKEENRRLRDELEKYKAVARLTEIRCRIADGKSVSAEDFAGAQWSVIGDALDLLTQDPK